MPHRRAHHRRRRHRRKHAGGLASLSTPGPAYGRVHYGNELPAGDDNSSQSDDWSDTDSFSSSSVETASGSYEEERVQAPAPAAPRPVQLTESELYNHKLMEAHNLLGERDPNHPSARPFKAAAARKDDDGSDTSSCDSYTTDDESSCSSTDSGGAKEDDDSGTCSDDEPPQEEPCEPEPECPEPAQPEYVLLYDCWVKHGKDDGGDDDMGGKDEKLFKKNKHKKYRRYGRSSSSSAAEPAPHVVAASLADLRSSIDEAVKTAGSFTGEYATSLLAKSKDGKVNKQDVRVHLDGKADASAYFLTVSIAPVKDGVVLNKSKTSARLVKIMLDADNVSLKARLLKKGREQFIAQRTPCAVVDQTSSDLLALFPGARVKK